MILCGTSQVEEGVAGGRIFVVGGMPQLADYVYKDYHVRINALEAKVQHVSIIAGSV